MPVTRFGVNVTNFYLETLHSVLGKDVTTKNNIFLQRYAFIISEAKAWRYTGLADLTRSTQDLSTETVFGQGCSQMFS